MAVDTSTIQIVMPAMGDSVAEGTILEWHKQEGDAVEIDETIVEISTDKVDAEVPAPASGTIIRILAGEGETVEVGAPLAEMATNRAGPPPFSGALDALPVSAESPPATREEALAGAATEAEGAAAAATAAGEIVEIVTPTGGESVTEGTILDWSVKVGDRVNEGDTVVEISTDKVDMELPAPASGTITEILAQDGVTVTVGQVIARMTTGSPGAEVSAGSPPVESRGAPAGDSSPAMSPATSRTAPPSASEAGDIAASPVARRVAAADGIDLARVKGSARRGRITKADVLSAAGDGKSASADSNGVAAGAGHSGTTATAPSASPTQAPGTRTQLKGGASALARYMDESRQVPTATSFRTFTVTVLDQRRRQLKEAGQRVSFTHLIAYAIAVAATERMPAMANHYEEVDGKPYRIDDGAVNLGLAVDVEKKDGTRTLMVPVIRDAGRLDFATFREAYSALVEKARENKLTPSDLLGGNVTLTNPGGLGTVASVPRLMVAQGTILATGSIAYPVGLGSIGEMIGADKVMTMTSTYDHRIIQGAESGRFLAVIESYLQGEESFYERVFGDLGVALPGLPPPPAPAAAAAAASAAQGPEPASAPAPAAAPAAGAPDEELLRAVQAATSLLKAHRTHGHLAAHLDPLGSTPEGDPALDPEQLDLTPELMAKIPAHILRMYVPGATLADALPHLRETYCGPIAYEIEHIASHEQRLWLRERIESGAFRAPLRTEEQKALLRRLTQVDALERFMHKAYLGQKQFSIEGLDMTVPMLDETIQLSASRGAREVVIGMAHRGRLNVLAHNLGRRYDTIFAEFEGSSTLDPITTIPQGGTGDVKYHHGAQGSYGLSNGESVIVRLESNPSHLEFVAPVAAGATRAAQTTRQGPHAHLDTNAAVNVILHGDAAFPGQGIVAETLNLQALDGYTVGGTIHLIQNNQVGFTTDSDDARSTRWASDLAKGYDVPIIHVNADNVAACIAAVRLAFEFRERFGHDVLIDLIGYRRFGHNEADEPAYTQPEMYQLINKHSPVRELYARELIEQGVVTEEESTAMTDEVWAILVAGHEKLKAQIAAAKTLEHHTGEYQLDRTASPEVRTAVSEGRLKGLNEELLAVPDGFIVHPKLVKQLEQRREAVGIEGAITWAHAESLAFASLLTEGIPIRLTGQDAERGTFSQRHLVLHDARTGQEHSPIQHLPGALAPMELHNSPLSEQGCLGFEYGYAQEGPETLVLWEAQFGDFVNGAEVIVDQFITPGLAKWGQTSRLTLLLPHGYEGSGPEHSSARLERWLQLAAEGNIRVANCTTPAQYFHLLRRQARVAKQRPLFLMTPKSLLRLPQARSSIDELAKGHFHPVLPGPGVDPEQVTRLVLCSGKVYYDLTGHAAREDNPRVAIGRVELLYPFPQGEILALLASYPNLEELVWVQEEPRNMGARMYMAPRLLQVLPDEIHFGYIGRPERAASGEGYPIAHAREQGRIVTTALDLSQAVSQYPRKSPGER